MTEIIHHFRTGNDRGGLAVMAKHEAGDSFFRVTTAKCSSADAYNKKVACSMLRSNFDSGNTIVLPLRDRYRKRMTHRMLRDVVIEAFAAVVYQHVF